MAGSRRCVALACVILLAGPLAACSKDKKPAASSASSSSTAPSTNSSPAPSSESSSSSSSSSSSTGPCTAPPPPATAVRRTDARGDFNGDQADDVLTVYGTGSNDQPGPYHLHVALAAGSGEVDVVIGDADPTGTTEVKALGGADITASAGLPPDGSGEEAFITVGSGASSAIVAVYQLTGCNLERLKDPQGQPAAFPVNGSVTHLGGLRCDGTAGGVRLVQLSATSDDGVTYSTTESRLQVTNGQFVVTNTVNGSINSSDPRLQAFATIDCPGVAAP